jgi:hypothetical protein
VFGVVPDLLIVPQISQLSSSNANRASGYNCNPIVLMLAFSKQYIACLESLS